MNTGRLPLTRSLAHLTPVLRWVLAAVAMLALIGGAGSVAQAQATQGPYGATPQTVAVQPASVAPGGSISVQISGCTPSESLTITLVQGSTTTRCSAPVPIRSNRSDSNGAAPGTASAEIVAPTEPGVFPGNVVGTRGFDQSFTVTVIAPTPRGVDSGTETSQWFSTTSLTMIGMAGIVLALFAVTRLRRMLEPYG